MTYWWHGNNPSNMKRLNDVMKTINKEECNNFVIPLPAWIAWFTLHIFLTPQHNLVKECQKDPLIFNAAKRPTMDAIPINLITSTKYSTELNCTLPCSPLESQNHIPRP